MATLTISLSGSGVVNGSKSYTVTDADIQRVLTWAAVAFGPWGVDGNGNPINPTNAQILLAWVQSWINGTIDAIKTTDRQIVNPAPVVIS